MHTCRTRDRNNISQQKRPHRTHNKTRPVRSPSSGGISPLSLLSVRCLRVHAHAPSRCYKPKTTTTQAPPFRRLCVRGRCARWVCKSKTSPKKKSLGQGPFVHMCVKTIAAAAPNNSHNFEHRHLSKLRRNLPGNSGSAKDPICARTHAPKQGNTWRRFR